MTYFKQEIKNDIERWNSYGWEWRVIRNLLYRTYGIDISKTELSDIISNRRTYGNWNEYKPDGNNRAV